jgi:excisionase family DNA binding protein
MTTADMPSFLTARQAAAVSGVNERTVRRWLRSGELKAGKVGRDFKISSEAFAAFLRARRGATADSGHGAAADAAMPAEPRGVADIPTADSAALLRALDLVDKLTQQNLEMAGRLGFYQAENQRLLALVAPTEAPQPPRGRLRRVWDWLAP